MKKLVLLVLCSTFFVAVNAQKNKKELVAKMFSGVMVMADAQVSAQTPIASINELAAEKAHKSAELNKKNIETLLAEAKNYTSVFVTVGNHTIVKITDLADCKPSGAWGTCMPKGEGYVQKGDMESKTDYINFIIGVPDGQTRTIYMFK